jgi:hypothetical protein
MIGDSGVGKLCTNGILLRYTFLFLLSCFFTTNGIDLKEYPDGLEMNQAKDTRYCLTRTASYDYYLP